MSYCRVNQCNYYYKIIGHGEPVVMIRGLGSNSDHWYAQVPDLSKIFQLLVFDNPGIARTADTEAPYSIRGMSEDVIGLMDRIGIEKAHIFGLSMGGMIAQEIAINHPERVIGLILCVTHCGGPNMMQPSNTVAKLFADMIQNNSEDAKLAASAALFAPQTLQKKPELALEYGNISMRFPVPSEVLIKQWESVLRFDTWDRLPRVLAPTLVLGAAYDTLIPTKNSEILAERIPKAKLLIIEDGGHQVLIEQPDACNKAVIEFLKHLK